MIQVPTYYEGTLVFYRKGIYYLMWSENNTRSEDFHVRYGTSDSPLGKIIILENNLLLVKSKIGAFQLLSQIALWNELPEEISPGQVRSALYAVVKRQIEAPGTFDEKGCLRIGFVGHQLNIGEGYISTGSLYLCCEAFLVLGQDPDGPFWTAPAEEWTQKKLWSGKPVKIDHAIKQ